MINTDLENASKIMIGSLEVEAMYIGNEKIWLLNNSVVPLLLDILYSDTNGNLSFTSEVLPASEGKIPIALCIARTGFFGENEPARWMSLKYMNYTTPDIGSLTAQGIYFGNNGIDISTITNINKTYNNGPSYGNIIVDYYDNSSVQNKLPSILDENNEWNLSILGTVNMFAMTDIDGKNKTDKILATATAQTTWQTDTSIDNQSGEGYAPAACCCARYHTLGTQQGDWYLPACGEICMILAKKTDINTKLTAIHTIYSNDCITTINQNSPHSTSTEYNVNTYIYSVHFYDGRVYFFTRNSNTVVFAMLQY